VLLTVFGARVANVLRQGLPVAVLLVTGGQLFPSAGRDDSHITYWAAHALSSFGEILNFNGDRFEQSSSLLHVLLLAAIYAVSGFDLVTVGRVFSVLCGVATLLAVSRLGERIQRDPEIRETGLVAPDSDW
jgi:hypothetical protein